jgi:predicted permease
LLRPLPYPRPEQLVTLNHIYPSVDLVAGVSLPGFRDYRDRTRSFESVAVTRTWSANLTGVGDPVRVDGSRVSAGYFETYAIRPVLGRSFRPEEETPGNDHVVVLSHGFWRLRLGGDPNVLERAVLLNDESYQVIGVLPPEFEDFFNADREFWVPLALPPERFTDDHRFSENQSAVARMRPGVSLEMAGREMSDLAETIKSELTRSFPPDWTVRVRSLQDQKTSGYRTTLLVLFGAVGFVLLITCANVANLLLARGIGRQKEIAIRKALGASRGQVARQLVAECLILSLLGGGLGLLVAYWGIDVLAAIGPAVIRNTTIALDVRVLLFALGVSFFAGFAFGLAPAVQGIRGDLQSTLREGGQSSRADRGGQRLRRALIVAEFALALILLAGSGLMIKTIAGLRQVDPGFNPDNILTANLLLTRTRYPDRNARNAFFDQLLAELKALPGIKAAATTTVLPFGGNWSTVTFNVEGYAPQENDPPTWGDMRVVSPGFTETLEIPVLDGRFFDQTDGPGTQAVCVVDEEAERRFWPDRNPIGGRLTFDDPDDPDARWITVVGVVGHTLHAGLDDDIRVQLYFPSRQWARTFSTIMLRTETEPEAMVSVLRETVLSVDPSQPISDVRVLDKLVTESIGNRRLLMTLLTVFSGLAILLASLGIYGIMSHMVRERSHELGLRKALGATQFGLFGLVLKNGLRLAAIGLALGLGGSLWLTRLMQSQLFNVDAVDPTTLAVVVGILLAVAVSAICIPANRASRSDPISSLRAE